MILRAIVVAAVLGIATLAAAASASAAFTPVQAARIDSAVVAVIERSHIPGLTIAVVAGGELRWEKAYGLADVENSVPATTGTAFRIASVSKALTATAALQLAEAKKLDLDAPVQKYAPAFPKKPYSITTRQLLGHLSGIRHYRRGEPEYTTRFESLTAALEVFKDDTLEHEPGTRYTYTTYGYTLVGVAIEGASGVTYMDYMTGQVFRPAGMTSTRADDPSAIVPHRARGYTPAVRGQFDGKWVNARLMDSSYKLPGGGLLSTAGDLARFAIALMRGSLVGKDALRQITISGKTRDGTETDYSYGWYVERFDPQRPEVVIHHGGVQAGFSAELWLLPEKRFAVAVLTNLEGGGRLGLGKLAHDIAGSLVE